MQCKTGWPVFLIGNYSVIVIVLFFWLCENAIMREEEIETAIKVVVVGNGAVGKSSMIQRYCKGIFTKDYKKTIGVDFLERQIEWVDLHKIAFNQYRVFVCQWANSSLSWSLLNWLDTYKKALKVLNINSHI